MKTPATPFVPAAKFAALALGLAVAAAPIAPPALADNHSKGESGDLLTPLLSAPDYTRGGGWGAALGVGAEYEPAYDGAEEYEVKAKLAGGVHWRSGNHLLFWEGNELGWRGRGGDRWLLQGGARYEGGLEADDSEDGHLKGIAERDDHFVGFFELRRAVGDGNWRTWLGGRLAGGDRNFGWMGVLAAGRRFGDREDGGGTEAYMYATFGSSANLEKDFGVSAADAAASNFAVTNFSSGYRSVGINVLNRWHISEQLILALDVGAEVYSNDINDSPLTREQYELEAATALMWHF